MKKITHIKSISCLLLLVILVLYILLMTAVSIEGETMPPYYFIIITGFYLIAALVISLVERHKDIKDPARIHDLAKYFRPLLSLSVIGFWLICSQDILVNTFSSRPVDYSMLPSSMLHTVGYILYSTIVIILTIYLIGFISKVIKKLNLNKNNTSIVPIIISFIFFMIFYISFKESLRWFWRLAYGFYSTDFSRYGDISSFLCFFTGIFSCALVISVQSTSRFVPLKYLNQLMDSIIKFDKKERDAKKMKAQKSNGQ